MRAAGPPDGVGRTALGMARVRADETCSPDPLVVDHLAQLFLDAAPGALPEPTSGADPELVAVGAALAGRGIVRTRFFDDHLRAAATAAGQVVLLAAGLDSRAYRLPWPAGVRLFEVDLADVLAFKERVLAAAGARPNCRRTAVVADLAADWLPALRGAGFDPTRPTAWLAEGLRVYLDDPAAGQLLATVTRASAPGSTLALEAGGRGLLDRARRLPAMAPFAALQRGGLATDPAALLAAQGWRTSVHEASTSPVGTAARRSAPRAAGSSSPPATTRSTLRRTHGHPTPRLPVMHASRSAG